MRSRSSRLALGLCAALVTGLTVLSEPASAHVTVHPDVVPRGASDVEVTFRVPNERDNASTVGLQVFFPTSPPLLTVDVAPVPGWSSEVSQQTLSKPVQTDDGPVSQVVSQVTWTATSGGIQPGQYQDFPISVGAMPSSGQQLVFKALQTYSSGEIVRWIDLPVAGQPEPDHPAPILALASAGGGTTDQAASSSSQPSSDDSATYLSVAALVVAAGSLAIVAAQAMTRRRKREPT